MLVIICSCFFLPMHHTLHTATNMDNLVLVLVLVWTCTNCMSTKHLLNPRILTGNRTFVACRCMYDDPYLKVELHIPYIYQPVTVVERRGKTQGDHGYYERLTET